MEKVEYWLSRDGKKFNTKEECSRYEELNLQDGEDLRQIKEWIITIGEKRYPSIDLPEINGPADDGFHGILGRRSNPCEFCINNPANNPYATGFCNCAAPYLANPTF